MQCLFCESEHVQDLETSWTGRVSQLAPFVGSRNQAFKALASDPVYRAVYKAWGDARETGLTSASLSFKIGAQGGSLRAPRGKGNSSLTGSLNLRLNAAKADKRRATAVRILGDLDKRLASALPGKGSKRSEALAAMTQVQLQLVIVNLVIYSAWCREIAPGLLGKKKRELIPPEYVLARDVGTPIRIYNTSLSLCHGVRPFFDVELPGGELVAAELKSLDRRFTEFETEYGHTGYVVGLHRAGIARFEITFEGPPVDRVKRPRSKTKTKSKRDKKPTTPPKHSRPVRVGGSSGRTGGATTGGGK